MFRRHSQSGQEVRRRLATLKARRSTLEPLEGRQLCATDFRTLDGTGNNVQKPQLGSTVESYVRLTPAEYTDGIASPAGADRPSARAASIALGWFVGYSMLESHTTPAPVE